MVHLPQHRDLAGQLGGLTKNGRDDEAALGIGLHFAAEVGGGLQELALGGTGGRQRGQAGLNGLPDRQGVEAGRSAIQLSQIVPQGPAPLALGEGLQLGLEGGGKLEASLLIHCGR